MDEKFTKVIAFALIVTGVIALVAYVAMNNNQEITITPTPVVTAYPTIQPTAIITPVPTVTPVPTPTIAENIIGANDSINNAVTAANTAADLLSSVKANIKSL